MQGSGVTNVTGTGHVKWKEPAFRGRPINLGDDLNEWLKEAKQFEKDHGKDQRCDRSRSAWVDALGER